MFTETVVDSILVGLAVLGVIFLCCMMFELVSSLGDWDEGDNYGFWPLEDEPEVVFEEVGG